jgi:hypothetical protein
MGDFVGTQIWEVNILIVAAGKMNGGGGWS